MKIRRPWMIKATGFAAAWALRLWMGTLEYRYRGLGLPREPNRLGGRDRFIFVLWHENMLLPAYRFAGRDQMPLISEHADGQLIHEVCRNLGIRSVRGSTTRGSVRAVRQMLRAGRQAHLWITPDGPRGPRRHVQPGVVYLASRTGLPVVPVGVGHDRPWRTRSWDRLAVPRPWTLGTCVTGVPIAVPARAERDELEEYRRRVEAELLRVSALAERWAETGRWPRDWPPPAAPAVAAEQVIYARVTVPPGRLDEPAVAQLGGEGGPPAAAAPRPEPARERT